MNRTERSALVDLDDTTYNMADAMKPHLDKEGITYTERDFIGGAQNSPNIEIRRMFLKLVSDPNFVYCLPPLPGALEGYEMLHKYGFPIHIFTGREEGVREASLAALERDGFAKHCTECHFSPPFIRASDFKYFKARQIKPSPIAVFDNDGVAMEPLVRQIVNDYQFPILNNEEGINDLRDLKVYILSTSNDIDIQRFPVCDVLLENENKFVKFETSLRAAVRRFVLQDHVN